MTPRERLDAIEKKHHPVAWQEEDETGMPHEPGTGHDLTPFCHACTDEEVVDAFEFGDLIDLSSVVDWPCETATLVAFARAVLDATEASGAYRVVTKHTIQRLADEHLGAER